MILAKTRFVDLPWYAPPLDLRGTYPWKGNITKVEAIRSTGTGFDNFTGSNFSSLTGLETGKFYRLDLKNLPAAGVSIDNGTPPTGTVIPDYEIYDIPAGTAVNPFVVQEQLSFFGVRFGKPVLTNKATGQEEAGTITYQLAQGQITDYAGFNAAMATVSEETCAENPPSYLLSVSVTSGVAVRLTTQLLNV